MYNSSLAVLVCSRLDLFCNVIVSIFLVIDSQKKQRRTVCPLPDWLSTIKE